MADKYLVKLQSPNFNKLEREKEREREMHKIAGSLDPTTDIQNLLN